MPVAIISAAAASPTGPTTEMTSSLDNSLMANSGCWTSPHPETIWEPTKFPWPAAQQTGGEVGVCAYSPVTPLALIGPAHFAISAGMNLARYSGLRRSGDTTVTP